MLQRLSKPETIFMWWLMMGLVVGITIAQLIDSFAVGIPMGVALSLLVGKASYRISRGLLRIMR